MPEAAGSGADYAYPVDHGLKATAQWTGESGAPSGPASGGARDRALTLSSGDGGRVPGLYRRIAPFMDF
ncbi:MAG: hypothetical protein ACLRWQ_19615 [Flavonifractor plautii]